jgi:hypothetical protein
MSFFAGAADAGVEVGVCALAGRTAPTAKPANAAPFFRNPLRLGFFESISFSFEDEVTRKGYTHLGSTEHKSSIER